jgi:hypothetical protein
MALPAAYDETTLSELIIVWLGPTATALEWETGSDTLSEVVNETLLAYGVATMAESTDIAKVRAIARWQAWRAAADALASQFNQTIGDQSLQLKALFDHAEKQRDYWHGQAMPHLGQWAVTATPIVHLDDPVDAPIRYHALRNI